MQVSSKNKKMKIIQERKLSMYLVVNDVLKGASATTMAQIPKFGEHATAFDGNVTQLQTTREEQELDGRGLTVNKQVLKIALIAEAMDAANKLKAFALNTDDAVLAAEVGYSESALVKSADTVLRDKCQVIHSRAVVHAAALVDYGITATDITDLQTAITAYQVAIPKPRLAITVKKQVTDQLDQLFDASDALLNKLDVLAEIVKNTDPVFYQQYNNARKVTGPGYRKLPVMGLVKDAGTLLPLSGVTITVEETNLKRKTTAKGYFQLKSLAEGMYVFTFYKNGYQAHTLPVAITKGERVNLEVELAMAV